MRRLVLGLPFEPQPASIADSATKIIAWTAFISR
jgi:hypothetical protein